SASSKLVAELGSLMSRTSSVIVMAKTESLNVSSRLVSRDTSDSRCVARGGRTRGTQRITEQAGHGLGRGPQDRDAAQVDADETACLDEDELDFAARRAAGHGAGSAQVDA